MNVEIGAEAVQFPEKEYINGIVVAVYNGSLDCLLSFLVGLELGGWAPDEFPVVAPHSMLETTALVILIK